MKKFGADKFDLRTAEEKSRGILAFAWVTEFPLFKKTKEGSLTYGHNPFTGPRPQDEAKLLHGRELEHILSLQYDLVCNGEEVGGGGIRITKAHVLEKVFEIIGHTREEVEREFGHMLKAFRHGAPPEGGIALGVDRMVAILAGEESIREVQAFPMTSGGRTSAMDAPSGVSEEQLKELGIAPRRE